MVSCSGANDPGIAKVAGMAAKCLLVTGAGVRVSQVTFLDCRERLTSDAVRKVLVCKPRWQRRCHEFES